MRYQEIVEHVQKTRLCEERIDQLEQYLGKGLYITFRFMEELKVPISNNNMHQDPLGIYTYPLDACWPLLKDKSLSFTDRPYLHVLKPMAPITKLSQVSQSDVDDAIKKIEGMLPTEQDNEHDEESRMGRFNAVSSSCGTNMPGLMSIKNPQERIDKAKWYVENPDKMRWTDVMHREIPDDKKPEVIQYAKDVIKRMEEENPDSKPGFDGQHNLKRAVEHSIEVTEKRTKTPGQCLWNIVFSLGILVESELGINQSKFETDMYLKLGIKIVEDDIGNVMGGFNGNEKYQAVFMTDDSYQAVDLFTNVDDK